METVKLQIEGMHCEGCARSIEQLLTMIEGVHEAKVSYRNRAAEVDYEPNQIEPGTLREQIETMGYRTVEEPG